MDHAPGEDVHDMLGDQESPTPSPTSDGNDDATEAAAAFPAHRIPPTAPAGQDQAPSSTSSSGEGEQPLADRRLSSFYDGSEKLDKGCASTGDAQEPLSKGQHPDLHAVQLENAERHNVLKTLIARARIEDDDRRKVEAERDDDRRKVDAEREVHNQELLSLVFQGIQDLTARVFESEISLSSMLAVSEDKIAHKIELINNRVGLAISGPASTSATHMHRMPNGQAANTGDPQLFAPCRDEPACAGSTDECKSEGTDLANSQFVDGAIQ